jgi:hypothetical protein
MPLEASLFLLPSTRLSSVNQSKVGKLAYGQVSSIKTVLSRLTQHSQTHHLRASRALDKENSKDRAAWFKFVIVRLSALEITGNVHAVRLHPDVNSFIVERVEPRSPYAGISRSAALMLFGNCLQALKYIIHCFVLRTPLPFISTSTQ